MSPYDPESRTPGLAGERTDLAWNRSGLSLLACGAVVLRGIGNPPLITRDRAAGLCIVALAGVASALGWWAAQRSRSRGARPAGARDLRPISLAVAAMGVAAFLLATLSR